MKKVNVLFLDFDGPLTNTRAYLAFDKPMKRKMWTTADPIAIAFLNRLCKEYNVKIVVSSTWRKHNAFVMNPTGVDAKESLRLWGFTGEFHEDWRTIDNSRWSRSEEIIEWLTRHIDEVDIFATLDDMTLDDILNPVTVDCYDGTSSPNMERLESIFNRTGKRNSVERLKEHILMSKKIAEKKQQYSE